MNNADPIELQIMQKIASNLGALDWLKLIEYEQMRNLFEDFNESEIPGVQIYDREPATVRHQHGLIEVQWPLSIELILKSTKDGYINQGDLFRRKRQILDVISADLHLGGQIPGFQHLRFDGWETDLHSTPNFFAIALRMTALYLEKYPGC